MRNYKTVTTEVEVDVFMEEFETEDLVEELKLRGVSIDDNAEKIEALISVLKYLIESADKYIEESSWLATLCADIHLAKTTLNHIEKETEGQNDTE